MKHEMHTPAERKEMEKKMGGKMPPKPMPKMGKKHK